MTTLTIPARDSATMLGREFKHTVRFPLLLVGSILVPVVLLLLFVYILGGPIGHGLGDAARGAPYIDFLVPGILVITVAAGSGTTAINVCTDMTGGIFDRFLDWSPDDPRLSVLADRTARWMASRYGRSEGIPRSAQDPAIAELVTTPAGVSSPAWDRLTEIAKQRHAGR